ncbi:hypothetical protein, partial [Providencia stuartii]|uniref:hypothetical protein n=1 Tax=Providencia stuartii TaxID=588 RepID=UPI0013D670ED
PWGLPSHLLELGEAILAGGHEVLAEETAVLNLPVLPVPGPFFGLEGFLEALNHLHLASHGSRLMRCYSRVY